MTHPHWATISCWLLAIGLAACGGGDDSSGGGTAPSGSAVGADPDPDSGSAKGEAPTNTIILSSSDPSVVGKEVTFVVAVAPAVSSLSYPTGDVTVSVDGVAQSAIPLTKGSARLTVTALTDGNHSITANYTGDSTYSPSNSNALTQRVTSTWEKPMQYGIDVTRYGIQGDGVTDNTAAMNALIASFSSIELVPGSPARGGQRLYFPAGTYMFSDSINLARLGGVTLVGDVDQDRNPTSILKANSIATPHSSTATADYSVLQTYYPFLMYDGNNYAGCSDGCEGNSAGGPIRLKNLQILAPNTPGSAAVILGNTVSDVFENLVVSGYYGIIGMANPTAGSSVRDTKFIGPNLPGSVAVSHISFVVDNSYFTGWGIGVLPTSCGLAITRSTFDHNYVGIKTGTQPNLGGSLEGKGYFSQCASIINNVFHDNDVGIYTQNDSYNRYYDNVIVGSNGAPSGTSKAGFMLEGAQHTTFDGFNISGPFTKGAMAFIGTQTFDLTFYGSQVSNSKAGAPAYDYDLASERQMCPAHTTCAYERDQIGHPGTIACTAGTIQVMRAIYDSGGDVEHQSDCTAHVASQCNGKASCVVDYNPEVCTNSVPRISDPDYYPKGSAWVSCSGTTVNPVPSIITKKIMNVDGHEPGFIADVDNVTAAYFVSGPQPTVFDNAMFIDVTKQGIQPWAIGVDQAAAIQTIINGAADGSIFYFPQGQYTVHAPLDFSRLKRFTILGDNSTPYFTLGTSILLRNSGGALIKADYGTGAGTFRISDVFLSSDDTAVYAKNAVLPDLESIMTTGKSGVRLDNPFMAALRVFTTSISNDGGVIIFNGGMHSTMEMQNVGGGMAGIRINGVDHAVFGSRYEVLEDAGINVGVDPLGNPAPAVGISLASVQQEANGTGIKLTRCQNCSVTADLTLGHSLLGHGPNGTDMPDNHGLYLGDVHNTLVSASSFGGYFFISDLWATGESSNNYFGNMEAHNAWAGCPTGCTSPGSTTWHVDPASTGNTFLLTNKP